MSVLVPGIAAWLKAFRWLLTALAVSVLAFAKLAGDMSQGEALTRYDADLASTLSAHTTALLTHLFSAISVVGGSKLVSALLLTAVVVLVRRRRPADAAFVAAAVVGGFAVNALLKAGFHRPRPELADAVAHASGFSFPSGHTMAATTLYGALAYLVARDSSSPRVRVAAAGGALFVVVLVGASRLYLGAHYLSDVLAAVAAGSAWLLVCVPLLSAPRRRAPAPLRARPVSSPVPGR